jgi:hypothetical protein
MPWPLPSRLMSEIKGRADKLCPGPPGQLLTRFGSQQRVLLRCKAPLRCDTLLPSDWRKSHEATGLHHPDRRLHGRLQHVRSSRVISPKLVFSIQARRRSRSRAPLCF